MTTADFPGSTGGTYQGGTSHGGTYQGDDADQGGAQEKAQQVAGTAADEGRHVASTARDEAANVASETRAQARNLLSDASSELEEQSRTQQHRLAGTVRSFGDDLESMATDQSGPASDVARQVADRARSLASHLDDREPRELLDEVRDFARRRPGTFLVGALAAGIVAGRLTRAAKAAQSDNGSAGGATTPAAYPPVPADVTTPVDPLTTGLEAPSSGAGSGVTGEPGTATGDPLAGTRVEHSEPTYPVAAEPDAPGSDRGNRP